LTNLAADNSPDSRAHAGRQNIRFTACRVHYGPGVRDRRRVCGRRRLIHGRVILGCRTLDIHWAIHIHRAIDIYRPLDIYRAIDYELALYVHRPFCDSIRRITAVNRTLIAISPLPAAVV
jgi:hypothetical protein